MLFEEFFYGLRKAGLKVGLGEWMAVLQALSAGAITTDLKDFYLVARALLIKNEALYDTYDQVFSAVFGSGTMPTEAIGQLLEWLKDPQPFAGEMAEQERLAIEALQKLFAERLREQTERHDGGNRWVGTGGTSPFGHHGFHPGGLRVGGGGGGKSAAQVAMERRFRDYAQDRVLDTRSIAVALKRLRRLSANQGELELDIEESIDQTCRNAGDLTLFEKPPRKNQARVLLMMDAGGSMDPFTQVVEQLFSAASQLNHWKKFEAFTFHNCVYEKIYTRIATEQGVFTKEILAERPPETYLIMVGDALMAGSELTDKYGAVQMSHQNTTPGLVWLHRLRSRFPRCVWLNPVAEQYWNGWTIQMISEVFPMFPLTLAGLDRAIDQLMKHAPVPPRPLDPRYGE